MSEPRIDGSGTVCKHCGGGIILQGELWYTRQMLKLALDSADITRAAICEKNSEFKHEPAPAEQPRPVGSCERCSTVHTCPADCSGIVYVSVAASLAEGPRQFDLWAFAQAWYETAKAANPHHFAEHEDENLSHDGMPDIICEYTFEHFWSGSLVQAGLKTLRQFLAAQPVPGAKVEDIVLQICACQCEGADSRGCVLHNDDFEWRKRIVAALLRPYFLVPARDCLKHSGIPAAWCHDCLAIAANAGKQMARLDASDLADRIFNYVAENKLSDRLRVGIREILERETKEKPE